MELLTLIFKSISFCIDLIFFRNRAANLYSQSFYNVCTISVLFIDSLEKLLLFFYFGGRYGLVHNSQTHQMWYLLLLCQMCDINSNSRGDALAWPQVAINYPMRQECIKSMEGWDALVDPLNQLLQNHGEHTEILKNILLLQYTGLIGLQYSRTV